MRIYFQILDLMIMVIIIVIGSKYYCKFDCQFGFSVARVSQDEIFIMILK
jgi:hypothetical protein